MIREILNISHIPYIVDMFDAYADDFVHYDEFVMIRNYEIVNDIFIDKDLYFISKDKWDTIGPGVIWPVNEDNGGGFATDHRLFNGFLSDYGLTNGFDVNILYNKYKNVAKVRCNKIRIYRPTIKKYNTQIIHVDNFINNVHMHYFCEQFHLCDIHCEDEFVVNNLTYSEYIEFYVPNVYDLFKNDKLNNHIGCYYKESLNIVDSTNIRQDMMFIDKDQDIVYFPLEVFSLPSEIVLYPDDYLSLNNEIGERAREYALDPDNEKYYLKKYCSISKSIENNYLTYPVNVCMWPHTGEIINNRYVRNDGWDIGTVSFMTEMMFTLSANMGFVDNIVSIITEFKYPESEKFTDKYDKNGNLVDSAVKQAYMKYNNVKEEHYQNVTIGAIEKYEEELDRTPLNKDDIVIVEDYYRRRGHKIKVTMDNIRELYKDMKMTSLMEEIDEDQKVPLKFIGFRILIASDLHFKHLIYDKNFKIDFKNLDNFSFALDDLFESWVNVYEGYYMARVMFIDRILGVQIVSNPVMLGPEWVKYMVNSINERILEFDNLDGKSMPTIGYDNKENDNEEDNMFNFIENVRCVVNTTSREGEGNVIRGGNAPKVLYKPIFYRAGTLQNIKIRANNYFNCYLLFMLSRRTAEIRS